MQEYENWYKNIKKDDKRRDKGYGRRNRDRSESSSPSRNKNVKTNWKRR
jgi:hypothetical protein